MSDENIRVESVHEYLEQVCARRTAWTRESKAHFDPWFRGLRDASHELTPSLYRLKKKPDDEPYIRRAFLRLGANMTAERTPTNDWEWYFIMQHHRAPTRLLDWTDGALLALFFALSPAVAGQPDVSTDAAVWMLDPYWLNKQTIGVDRILLWYEQEARPYLSELADPNRTLTPELPVAIAPTHIHRRIAAQRGAFTLFGRNQLGLDRFTRAKKTRLIKFLLPKESIPRMRLDLATAGVSEVTMFPDFEGLSRELVRYWTEPWEESPGVWAR